MVVCLDLEGVLVPEIWIAVADSTGIPELRRTTRDEPDYDKLMRFRLDLLRRRGITLAAIQQVIGTLAPLPGAAAFLDALRQRAQVIILSDTYYEFAMPLMRQLGFPTLFCNRLSTDAQGFIAGYHLRQADGKAQAVRALKSLNFPVRAAGDSYNDLKMLLAADRGVLFRPPDRIAHDYPQLPVAREYDELLSALDV
jgi:phosphoserine/homoserine phosphotransferase